MASEKFCEKYFDIKISTLNFHLLSFATVGLYWLYWTYNICKSINKYFGETKIHPAFPLALAITWAWMWIFIAAAFANITSNIQHISIDEFRDAMYIVKTGLKSFLIIYCMLSIFIAFKANKYVEKMLADQGLSIQIAGPVTPCWYLDRLSIDYLYYAIFNAEERYAKAQLTQGATVAVNKTSQGKDSNRISQLENLAKLRSAGALSEEEFQTEKCKILSQ